MAPAYRYSWRVILIFRPSITEMDAGYYLDSFLAPLAPFLARGDVTDIYVNRPGEVWLETTGGRIEREDVAALDEALLGRLARQIAAAGSQAISREHPLLAATLPDGSRIQIVRPPATRAGHVLAIRRHVAAAMSLDDWVEAKAFSMTSKSSRALDLVDEYHALDGQSAPCALKDAVRARKNILISGGTSTGKTTFLNALLAEIPSEERLILIEDTEELRLVHDNAVGLLAARGQTSEARISAEDLLIAALRMRPDRIILGELRGIEAFTFLRAVNTGHPGSMTTIHADTPERAVEQLALLVLQAGTKLGWDDVRHYARASIDVFVQLGREGGRRGVAQVLVRGAS